MSWIEAVMQACWLSCAHYILVWKERQFHTMDSSSNQESFSSSLIFLRLHTEHFRICSVLFHQLFMAALFRDFSSIEQINSIRHSCRWKPVWNKDYRAVFCRRFNCFIEFIFRNRVERAGWFIQNQDVAVLGKSARNRDFLSLSTGKIDALFVKFPRQLRIRLLGQFLVFFGKTGKFPGKIEISNISFSTKIMVVAPGISLKWTSFLVP